MDFIGIGAQRTGTSWMYACLYEHPEICAPIKEIHFFSRPRFEKGIAWYLAHFDACTVGKKRGEFSTSYLYSREAAARIKDAFPEARIIMCLRHPVFRAVSEYHNALKAGEIPKDMTFDAYARQEETALGQGFYAAQVKRYLDLFPREQICILFYEESEQDPLAFIQKLYAFIGVDPTFVPSMLTRRINRSRVPRFVLVDRIMIVIAEWLRRMGLDGLVWRIKKWGLPRLIRKVNTEAEKKETDASSLARYYDRYQSDMEELGQLVGRDVFALWKRPL